MGRVRVDLVYYVTNLCVALAATRTGPACLQVPRRLSYSTRPPLEPLTLCSI